jgi:DNA-binding NarL/FixJ family response regulator
VLVRRAIRALLEREKFDVVAEASDGLEAVSLAKTHRPDVIVLDVSMPALNGISALAEVLKVSPKTKPILLTMLTEDCYTLRAIRAGAKGCVWKSQSPDELVHAIREVYAGRVYLSPSVSGAVVHAFVAGTEFADDPLTPRERQVLQLVAEGKTTKEIAVILGVAVKTADTHRAKVMEKLGIHSAAGLVRYAIRSGLIQP